MQESDRHEVQPFGLTQAEPMEQLPAPEYQQSLMGGIDVIEERVSEEDEYTSMKKK